MYHQPRVLLLSDSRGRGLEQLLCNNHWNIRFRVEVEPGATLNKMMDKLLIMYRDSAQEHNLIIIFAGICNVTRLVYEPAKMAVPRFDTVEKIVSEFRNECSRLLEIFGEVSRVPVILSPTVGIDMMAYASCHDETLYARQPTVDNAIILINRYIRETNSKNGLLTPNTSSCIHRNRGKGKGYRTHYIKLYDGCHPKEEVKVDWAEAFLTCCAKHFKLDG